MFCYRTYKHNILDMSVEKITIIKLEGYSNAAMNKQKKKIEDDNPEDFRIVGYTLKIKAMKEIVNIMANKDISASLVKDLY